MLLVTFMNQRDQSQYFLLLFHFCILVIGILPHWRYYINHYPVVFLLIFDMFINANNMANNVLLFILINACQILYVTVNITPKHE